MYDSVTLDQLRALSVVAEQGSFSAAARKLGRVQSAVSTAMTNLEEQLGVPIWDRSRKLPRLTEQGRAVLGAARRVLAEVDELRRLSSSMVQGLEPSVTLCVDALFPLRVLTELCARFAREFPSVDLRLDTQVMSAVSAQVLSGAADLGVVSPLGVAPGLERRVLAAVQMIPVTGPKHPLAFARGPITTARMAEFVQVVLSERLDTGVADQAVLSARTWRVGDLHTKHALLRASLGWGNLPEHVVRADLRKGKLVALRPAAWAPDEHRLHLSLVHRPAAVFGPAQRWLLGELQSQCVRELGPLPRRNRPAPR